MATKRKTIQSLTKEDLQQIRATAESDDMQWLKKDVKFLIYMSPELHQAAKRAAFDSELSLHDYILQCIKITTDVIKKK